MSSEDAGENRQQRERLRKSRKLGLCQKLSTQYRACYLDGQTPYERAQNFDGNFFEKFTSLERAEKLTESQKIQDVVIDENLNHREEDEGCDAEVLSSVETEPTLNDKQRAALYCELLYTVIHQLGAQDKTVDLSPGDLFVYAQEALNISEETHRTLYAKTKEREPPTCVMKVEVIEARHLEAKDANGLSDPYCMLGLMTEENEDEKTKKIKVCRKKSRSTVRDVLDGESIHMTQVKEDTLDPVWNETFTMNVSNFQTERFHLDIWDCDDKALLKEEDRKISKIKGISGMGRFFKDVMQSARKSSPDDNIDDFLGYIEIPVKDIPSGGIDKWFKLEGRSSKSRVDGDCHLKITLTTGKKPEIPYEIQHLYPTALDMHGAFLREFIKYGTEHCQESDTKRSSSELCPQAEFILHQHALQNELNDLQQASIRWMLFSHHHWLEPMKYSSLNLLLWTLEQKWKTGALSQREEHALVRSLKKFTDNCWRLMIKYRDIFPATDKGKLGRLINLLECLANVYKLEVFSDSIKEPLNIQMSNLLKESALAWYKKVFAWKEPQTKSVEAMLSAMVEVADALVTDMFQAKTCYRKIFSVTDVKYFTTVYNQLELMLASDVHNTMRNINKRLKQEGGADIVGEKLFSLYLAVKEVISYRSIGEAKPDRVYALDDYHTWFKQSVIRWLDIAQVKAKERIRKAVEIDKILRIDASVSHSTSAIDAVGCFHQIREFWKKIDWPDPSGSYVFVMQITDEICSSASYYADLLFEKMIKNNYYDQAPSQFDVSEQLCVTLNDIEYMRLWLSKLPENLGWEDVINAMMAAHGERGGKHARTALENMLSSSDEDMLNKIADAIEHIGQRMGVDIKRFFFQISCASDNIPAEDVVGGLLQYLDDDLMVLNTSVVKSVFQRILLYIWEIVMENFTNGLKTNTGRTAAFYQRQFEALEIVQSFFHADGVGLPLERLQVGHYKTLVETLNMRKLSTTELIQLYLAEKCEEQETVEEKYGAVTFKVFYDFNNQKLQVEVLNAKNLPPLDTNGLCDPYVTVELLPEEFFGNEVKKTEIIKNTLYPLFDEQFDFDVEPELLKETGACLHMTVMDYDVFSNDDFAGHVFFNLNNILGLREVAAGGFANVPQEIRNIFHPKPEGHYFEVLESRDDEKAQQFAKAQKDLYEKTISAHV
ncbi:BAI1-associated protein 3-like isoform X2 [Orbicella faveolata]|uniref:BAI1-associated protein 3-like isoform X2 n=1 Tax=Orbicella faveolata TaxID=48498 RepID=UPI0009E52ED5|nr:BAI1-associated protein 3-like isoform X2 [Orbicella faveolata]